jgi:hypothetical protein
MILISRFFIYYKNVTIRTSSNYRSVLIAEVQGHIQRVEIDVCHSSRVCGLQVAVEALVDKQDTRRWDKIQSVAFGLKTKKN